MHLSPFLIQFLPFCSLLLPFQSPVLELPTVVIEHLFDLCHVISHLPLVFVYLLVDLLCIFRLYIRQ